MEQIHIWGEKIPYNTGRDKKADMTLTKVMDLELVREILSLHIGQKNFAIGLKNV